MLFQGFCSMEAGLVQPFLGLLECFVFSLVLSLEGLLACYFQIRRAGASVKLNEVVLSGRVQ